MNLERYKTYHIPNCLRNVLELELETASKEDTDLNLNLDERLKDYLLDSKNQIETSGSTMKWDQTKKLANPFELIHISVNNQNIGIALYNPLSRSYFKLWEMIQDFNLFPNNLDPITSVHVAEAPGGFLEAVRRYRQKMNFIVSQQDRYYGMSLKATNKNIPNWKRFQRKIQEEKLENIYLKYNNLYNLNEVEDFVAEIPEKAYLVTGDGGFDYSGNFNRQEFMSYRILLGQIIVALMTQKTGGIFICKFFNINERMSAELLYLIYSYYDQVYITKPFTSRPANSEKYVVAFGFRGISIERLERLKLLLVEWKKIVKNKRYVIGMFKENIPAKFVSSLCEYNHIFIKNQMENINFTLDLIEEGIGDKEDILREKQKSCALEWCERYGIEINKKYFKDSEKINMKY